MKFIIKTSGMPSAIITDDWMAGEDSRTGLQFLSIHKRPFKLDPESFELIYYMSQNKLLDDDNFTMVIDRGHIDIWRI